MINKEWKTDEKGKIWSKIGKGDENSGKVRVIFDLMKKQSKTFKKEENSGKVRVIVKFDQKWIEKRHK